jgi:FlaA1/EpsC-like NDP-sugar epimerase
VRFVSRLRGRDLFLVDTVGIVLAAYVALAVRYGKLVEPGIVAPYLAIIAVLVIVRTVVDAQFGLYSTGWRFASVPDVQRIVAAVAVGTLVTAAVVYVPAALDVTSVPESFPELFWPIELLVTLSVLGGIRFAIRSASDLGPGLARETTVKGRPTLLYGAGPLPASIPSASWTTIPPCQAARWRACGCSVASISSRTPRRAQAPKSS